LGKAEEKAWTLQLVLADAIPADGKWFVSFLVCVVSFTPDLIHELSCKPGQDASLFICVLMGGGIIMYACSAPFLLRCQCVRALRTSPLVALLLLAAIAGTAEGRGPSTGQLWDRSSLW
jgi:hypothetical protein